MVEGVTEEDLEMATKLNLTFHIPQLVNTERLSQPLATQQYTVCSISLYSCHLNYWFLYLSSLAPAIIDCYE